AAHVVPQRVARAHDGEATGSVGGGLVELERVRRALDPEPGAGVPGRADGADQDSARQRGDADAALAVGVEVSARDAVVTAPDVDSPPTVAADHGPPHAVVGSDDLDAVPDVVVHRATNVTLRPRELHA